MGKLAILIIPIIIIIGCAQIGQVEFGINDETQIMGTPGNLAMRVLRIEVPEEEAYTVIWEGIKYVEVPIQSSNFISITDTYMDINPGTYDEARITIDSLQFVQNSNQKVIIDTTIQFTAQPFSPIVIESGDKLKLVICIASSNWFDTVTGELKPNHIPFEGAGLKIYYEY